MGISSMSVFYRMANLGFNLFLSALFHCHEERIRQEPNTTVKNEEKDNCIVIFAAFVKSISLLDV